MVFIIELAVGIAACLFKADLDDLLRNSLKKSIERSSADDLIAWDNVQRKLMCCGVTNPEDWPELTKTSIIRPSCCQSHLIDTAVNDCKDHPANNGDKYYQVKHNEHTNSLLHLILSINFI